MLFNEGGERRDLVFGAGLLLTLQPFDVISGQIPCREQGGVIVEVGLLAADYVGGALLRHSLEPDMAALGKLFELFLVTGEDCLAFRVGLYRAECLVTAKCRIILLDDAHLNVREIPVDDLHRHGNSG